MGRDDVVRRPRLGEAHGWIESLGPVAAKYQVWEAALAPHEKRTVTVEVGLTSKEDAVKAAATAGVNPVLPSDLTLLAPLDYQVFQRKTPLQGPMEISGRMWAPFDHLEYHLSGKPLEGTVRISGKRCPWRQGPSRSTLCCPRRPADGTSWKCGR